MSRIDWDKDTGRIYHTGIYDCVLYIREANGLYENGVAWNGITGITENASGAEASSLYGDDNKYLSLVSNEDFGATITAYTYPDEFSECDGSFEADDGIFIGQQKRKTFGLCYKTIIGNGSKGNSYGYMIHIIYGATASPTERNYVTVNESPEAINFSWEISTIPVKVSGGKWTSNISISSTKADSASLYMLEQILYGTEWTDPRLPQPEEIMSIMAEHDEDWLGGIFPVFDDIAYPYSGSYEDISIGFYKKYDERRF